MIEKFLKAKHWQLFLLIFGIPFVSQIVLTLVMVFASNDEHPNSLFFLNFMIFFPVIMALTMATHFGWFWSVAIGLQHKVPSGIKMKVKKFKTFFFIPLVYVTLILVSVSSLIGLIANGQPPSFILFPIFIAIIIPLHLLSMFCIFYSMYFVAKTFKTVELQREVSFSEFAGEFFMIWFYPIGVWFIQPKINQIIEN